jgi:monolysocardiolipin acyltransferase
MTIGEPITHKIQPLVDRWRELAAEEKGTLGVGGDWHPDEKDAGGLDLGGRVQEDSRQREVRGSGQLAQGREEEVRKQIVAILQEEVRKLGERVERKEGRFERGEWTQSRKMSERDEDVRQV